MSDLPEVPPPPPKRRDKPLPKERKKHKRIAWLNSARVVDMDAYRRLRATGVGARKLARALSIQLATAQKLMRGVHWQMDAEKVTEFNRFHSASIDPETGAPTADDLIKHGPPSMLAKASDSEGDKDLRRIMEDAGVAAPMVQEAMRRQRILAGAAAEGDLPGKVDTKWLQDAVDKKLGDVLTLMDPVSLAGASVADLTRAANMLFEKRALLRGEPTAIVRNEQRGGLDKLAEMLLAEVGRRGIALPKGPGGYQEVIE